MPTRRDRRPHCVIGYEPEWTYPGNYVRANATQTTLAAQDPRINVSLARIAFREHHHPSWKGPFPSVARIDPIVRGIRITKEPDQWGNRIFADVQYNDHGHRATYGGRVVEGRIKWQCYMD